MNPRLEWMFSRMADSPEFRSFSDAVRPPAAIPVARVGAARPIKPLYQRLTAPAAERLVVKELRAPGFDCPWHAHPECELIFVLESNGYRVVGDNLSEIRPGELILLGPNLPHTWRNDPGAPGPTAVHALLLQFDPHLFGDGLWQLPAFTRVRHLLERAARGLQFHGRTRVEVGTMMQEMAVMDGFDRLIQALRILGALAQSPEVQELASPSQAPYSPYHDQERMNRVFTYLTQHLEQPIRIAEVARVVNLSEGAFSRFFRQHVGWTFPRFVNELRVGRACRLLLETDKSIAEISYECGFGNLSNFNRQFLRTRKISPRQFRQRMQAGL